MFPINPSVLPSLPIRKALLVLDLQNDFVSADGALPVKDPKGLVSRTLKVAKAFRASGVGDVIWVRSEFDRHRPLSSESDQIATSDSPQLARRTTAMMRGRQPASGRHDQAAMEADEEAFLTVPPGSEKPACVKPDTEGSRLVAEVEEVIDAARDFTLTKTHYSAFATGHQLLQLLRGRFVTELYVCGALTNVSIYATALDAGQHGYDMTIVEDCCGYRSDMRHGNALRQLMDLTGCDVMEAADVISKMKPAEPDIKEGGDGQRHDRRGKTGSRSGGGESGSGNRKSPVRPLAPAEDDSSDLHLSLRDLTLSGASHPAPSTPPPKPEAKTATRAQPLQPLVKDTASTKLRRSLLPVDNSPLEVDPDPIGPSLPDDGGVGDDSRKPMDGGRSSLSNFRSSGLKGPPGIRNPTRRTDARKPSTPSHPAVDSKLSGGSIPRKISPIQAKPTSHTTRRHPSGESTSFLSTMEEQTTFHGAVTSEPLCEGDTTIIQNVLLPDLASTAFERLEAEVKWARMSHQGGEVPRLVAVQGAVDSEGNMPVYRHPADESPPLLPFSPTVLEIKAEVEKHLGHPLNHVLIQFYRDGNDYISEHSDKTLDIVHGSFIANVSLGAERTMIFRTKRLDKDPSRKHGKAGARTDSSPAGPDTTAKGDAAEPENDPPKRQVQRARLPHNSLCRMGLVTNMRWLHSIRQDKRAGRDKDPSELAFGGARISLTFRHIGTFLDASQSLIWGQGAAAKDRAGARAVANGQTDEATRMLRAFGAENHSSEFDWPRHYGAGFDVLHVGVTAPPQPQPQQPRWFPGADDVANARVALTLAGLGVSCVKGTDSDSSGTGSGPAPDAVRLVDDDAVVVEGHQAIMLYLDAVHGSSPRGAPPPPPPPPTPRSELARRLTRFQQASALLEQWRAAAPSGRGAAPPSALRASLAAWDAYAREAREVAAAAGRAAYMAGGERASIADYAVWPVLRDVARVCGEGFLDGYEDLAAYYRLMRGSRAVIEVFGEEGGGGDGDDGALTK
ncbi:hypothetical protein QBC33DRAFT_600078 [Phialemonium atrogriseum]|uniref:Fe2OG dioxygenase domain-containing protein n=1 Tax=Phialemonium atrogriseum TaxID=1093897 RepID=A0AAJ0BQG9_9PEZI|nr:uncharacterized protein QBC33DRAFT_600078 [Phialemonium atrogriseum]KAK1762594.1 hypothetical protein QBC33DRAFT_600078 [Phialemonium atrogriseum]